MHSERRSLSSFVVLNVEDVDDLDDVVNQYRESQNKSFSSDVENVKENQANVKKEAIKSNDLQAKQICVKPLEEDT